MSAPFLVWVPPPWVAGTSRGSWKSWSWCVRTNFEASHASLSFGPPMISSALRRARYLSFWFWYGYLRQFDGELVRLW